MKKSILFVAALALTFAACNPKEGSVEDPVIATFEEAAISPASAESYFRFKNDTLAYLKSGNFLIEQSVAYGGVYVAGGVVTNITDTEFKEFTDAYKSVKGGSYAGKNYLVWYNDAFEPGVIKLEKPAVVAGMYVTNNVYAYSSMTKGDEIAGGPFGDDDYLTLIIHGSLNGVEVNNQVEFKLAEGKDIVTDWEYVDLSKLGEIDELSFTMVGSRNGDWGLNTPTYFCIDNLGGKK